MQILHPLTLSFPMKTNLLIPTLGKNIANKNILGPKKIPPPSSRVVCLTPIFWGCPKRYVHQLCSILILWTPMQHSAFFLPPPVHITYKVTTSSKDLGESSLEHYWQQGLLQGSWDGTLKHEITRSSWQTQKSQFLDAETCVYTFARTFFAHVRDFARLKTPLCVWHCAKRDPDWQFSTSPCFSISYQHIFRTLWPDCMWIRRTVACSRILQEGLNQGCFVSQNFDT